MNMNFMHTAGTTKLSQPRPVSVFEIEKLVTRYNALGTITAESWEKLVSLLREHVDRQVYLRSQPHTSAVDYETPSRRLRRAMEACTDDDRFALLREWSLAISRKATKWC